jgi:hypothetical protein
VNLGLDYSAARPGGAAIRAAGYSFVVRYLDNGLSGRVNIDAAEVADLRANGVNIALVWERKIIGQPDRATQGASAGTADAQAARAAAAAVGLDGFPIYFAVDFDVPDYAPSSADPMAKLGPVGQYLLAARNVMGFWRMGVYGGFYAVSRALDAGLASLAWQTLAWSGGQTDGRIQLLQRISTMSVGGVDCDVNEQRTDYFGQSAPAPAALTSPGDIVFEFIANTDSPLQTPGSPLSATNGFTQVKQLVGGGLLVDATWADVRAKDKAWGGDGTGSVLGIPAAQYQKHLDTDTAVRTAYSHLSTLGSAGTAGATPAEVHDIVDNAISQLHSTTTYSTGA